MQTETGATDHIGQRLWRTFLVGLATLLPLAVTVIVFAWLARTAEAMFGAAAKVILPDDWYVPGLGILLAIGFVMLVGATLHAWFVNRLFEIGEGMLERIPGIKTIYTGMRDVLDFLSRKGDDSNMKHVVAIEMQPDVHVIGFVTDEAAGVSIPELARDEADPRVAVYLPMGYQIGGYTLYVPASRLRTLDLTVEQAMRVILTAGVNRPHRVNGDPEAEPAPAPQARSEAS